MHVLHCDVIYYAAFRLALMTWTTVWPTSTIDRYIVLDINSSSRNYVGYALNMCNVQLEVINDWINILKWTSVPTLIANTSLKATPFCLTRTPHTTETVRHLTLANYCNILTGNSLPYGPDIIIVWSVRAERHPTDQHGFYSIYERPYGSNTQLLRYVTIRRLKVCMGSGPCRNIASAGARANTRGLRG